MTPTETKTPPSKNGSPKDGAIVWTLYYIRGGPHTQTTHFMLNGDLRAAYARAKRHCEVMNYRFVRVEPFLIDLDSAENFLNQQEQPL